MKPLLRSLQPAKIFGISALALCLCPALASAAPCQTGSLQSYMALDQSGGCTIGQVDLFRFSSFSVVTTGAFDAATASTSTITITPIINAGGVGFSVSALQNGSNLFSIPNPKSTESVAYTFDYSLDPFVGDLELDPPVGNVTATQNYCLYDYLQAGCSVGILESQTVTTSNPSSQLTLSASKPIFLDVATSITLAATAGNPASFDALNITYGMGSAVPEPGSLMLMALGATLLIGFPVFRMLRAR